MEIKRSDLYQNKGHVKAPLANTETTVPEELELLIAELLTKKYMGGDDANS